MIVASSDRSTHPRVYTVPELLRDLRWVVSRLASLWSIWLGGRLPSALREQIIVAVAQVNACRMCEHAHTRLALEAGTTDAELAALQTMDEAAFDRQTWLILAHARARAKASFAPVPSLEERALIDAIGERHYRDAEDVAHVMTVANRIANTLNALSDRRHGTPHPESRLVDELIINVLFLPGAWLGTGIAAIRQRRSPFAIWRQARGLQP